MPELLSTYGLPGLFVVTALSGSVVPLPSEALLAALIVHGESLGPVVLVATVGNTLGAATLFWLGGRLGRGGAGGRVFRFLERRARLDAERVERARAQVRRWGAPAMLLSWLPFVGDAMVIAAGFAGISWPSFVLFAGLGKAARFVVVAAACAAAA